ncbi:MAG: GNAT family N-acetyltransferase [Chryseobacterium sp.]|uniref:GNAT family N-acetyltransferase n=1 Tax=Chryseobacterium sp. TaxID=1871047 RepID=UPI0025BA755D|nr:GNAT family protein [Chryseobacterium sp.]MCJ7932469.1 GNAT family N-acetyltransferase [Chryseobacterium sp.]
MMIELLPFNIENAEELISKIRDERILLQFAGPAYHFPLTKEQLNGDLADENRMLFRIVDTASQNTIGHAQLLVKEKTFLLGRILIWDESNRGKGYGKKTVRQLLEYGFSHFDQQTAELNVYDWNKGAIECYKKAGFDIDPEMKSEVRIEDEIWLSINMKIAKETFELQKS